MSGYKAYIATDHGSNNKPLHRLVREVTIRVRAPRDGTDRHPFRNQLFLAMKSEKRWVRGSVSTLILLGLASKVSVQG